MTSAFVATLVFGAVLGAGALTFTSTAARRPASPSDRARRPWPAWGTPALGALGAFALAGPVVAPLGAGAVLARRQVRVRRAERRAADARRAALPDALELFVTCVHAGRTPVQAIDELARHAPDAVRPAFAAVVQDRHRGRTLTDAVGGLTRLLGPEAEELVATVAAADRDGLALAPALDRLATEARHARRRAGEAAARRLPVQLSFPLVACTLPSFVLLAIAPAVLGALSTLSGRAP